MTEGRTVTARALLVAPDDSFREVLADVAREIGLGPVPVRSNAEAIETLAGGQIDLIIVQSDDPEEIVAFGRLAPTIAISDKHKQCAQKDLGVVCVLPMLFVVDDLERTIRACLSGTHLAPKE